MSIAKTVGIVACFCLLLTGAAQATNASGAAGRKGGHIKSNHIAQKADHAAQNAAAPAPRHTKPQAPIVMGRSVSAHHKSKLHHVKVLPAESEEIHEDSQL